jgi:hypothetical protein
MFHILLMSSGRTGCRFEEARAKIALGASMIASLALGASVANAGVTVGMAVGAPVKVRVEDNCFRPNRARPAYCVYPLDGRPVFVDGVWYRGPIDVRNMKGGRCLWFRGR